jgi:uncharacterized phage protein (TIGR01671 family)
VLLQYTGLNDKNGKEIYEGDIVRATFNDPFNYDNKKMPTETQTVIYSNGGFRLKEGPFNSYDGIGSFVMEVIGNIYENSELLEKKK